MSKTSVEALLEAGAHFGHLTRRWNPKMAKYIFGERNGIHIIDLRKTQILADLACEAAQNVASQGKTILFVGTKNQAKSPIYEAATRCGTNYVTERWLGGMLTNFQTIRKSIKRLGAIDKMEVDGTFEKLTKKERLMLSREREKLRRVFGGIENMTRLPGALFVVDVKKEHIAVKEAQTLGIPVIGIVDTNSDPSVVNFPIPANDDSIKAIELIANGLADSCLAGREIAKAHAADNASAGDRQEKESEDGGDDARVQRRMRSRKPLGGNERRGSNEQSA